MNKLPLRDRLKTEAGLAKNKAAAVVDLFFNKMSDALATGERVVLLSCERLSWIHRQKSKDRQKGQDSTKAATIL